MGRQISRRLAGRPRIRHHHATIARIAIGLGSNIEPEAHLRAAAAQLRERFPSILFSRVYRSAPLLYANQAAFLNAVAVAETDATPKETLAILQKIEHTLKKATPIRYGPRTIDLDLLLYGETTLPNIHTWTSNYKLPATSYKLMIPHPRMHERRFVLEPLCELLDPTERHPALDRSWGELLAETKDQNVVGTEVEL